MPNNASASHPNGNVITFIDEGHIYKDTFGQCYTSGTSVVKKAVPAFDADGSITKRCADRDGLSVDQIKAQWGEKGRIASEYGTKCHLQAEAMLTGNHSIIQQANNEKEQTAFVAVSNAVAYIQQNMKFLSAEQILFSPSLCIAGTADLLCCDPKSQTIFILDWKSNAEIKRFCQYGGKLLGALSHLDNCHLSIYSLQLALYAYIIRREGYDKANGMENWKIRGKLIHIQPGSTTPVWIDCMYVDVEVRDLIIQHMTLPF